MQKLLYLSLILFGFIISPSCSPSKNVNKEDSISFHYVSFFQNDVETILKKKTQTIEIEKHPFALRFYNKRYNPEAKEFYAAQVAAFRDKSDLDQVNVGMLKSDVASFRPGTGMAPGENGKYESLIFDNAAHHYLVYENTDSKRLDLLDKSGEFLKLEFKINGFFMNKKEIKMTDTEIEEFYLAILIDRNLNDTIEEGELTKLTIRIK